MEGEYSYPVLQSYASKFITLQSTFLSGFLRKTPRTGPSLGEGEWGLLWEGSWAKTGDMVEERWAWADWRWNSVLSRESSVYASVTLDKLFKTFCVCYCWVNTDIL